MKYRYLSHILTAKTPVYGNKKCITVKNIRSVAKGQFCNEYNFSINNHCGTHVDAPNHFFKDGEKIADFPAQAWFFNHPAVIKVDLKPSEILGCGKWIKLIPSASDILLFKSGWSKNRKSLKYIFENPGISPEVAVYLRNNFPKLRAIGIDWISISPYQNRPLGRQAHRTFLHPKGPNKPLLIIEDMNLSFVTSLKDLFVFPLLIKDIDSSLCTIVGRFA